MSSNTPTIVIPPPGPRAKAVLGRDRAWTSSCYIKEYPLVVERARGATVEDVDGNRYLDFMAGIAVASTGHAHPRVVEAIQQAAGKFLHICGSDFYYEGMAALAERLARLVPGPSKKRVFLTNSGAEAVEGALKLARYHTRRPAFVAFKGSFHGRTFGALSLTSSKVAQRAGFAPFLPQVYHHPYPSCYHCEFGKRYPDCRMHCLDALESEVLGRMVAPQDVAAIVVEPVQGEGGYVVPPADFLPRLRALCDRHGILLIADEVQSGVGRTGKMFACEWAGVEPDILTVAKGLGSGMPIGAFVSKESVTTWGAGAHGSTFGGNPVCCAAALATLDLVEKEYLANVERIGPKLLEGARQLAKDFPVVGDVRGLGMMIGIEFVKDRATTEPNPELVHALIQRAFQRGLLLLGAGKSALRLAPPLIIGQSDVDAAFGIIRACLKEALG